MAVKKYVADSSMYVWSLLRLALGYVFLWAFLDKALGLGFATCKSLKTGAVEMGCSQAWIHGGSPTAGFLSHATTGPFSNFYHTLSGNMWVDWLFMLGLLFVGAGLILGTWIWSACLVGVVMFVLMWTSLLWPANTPGLDEHLIYGLALFGIALTAEHQPWTLRRRWLKLKFVRALQVLK